MKEKTFSSSAAPSVDESLFIGYAPMTAEQKKVAFFTMLYKELEEVGMNDDIGVQVSVYKSCRKQWKRMTNEDRSSLLIIWMYGR